MRKHLDETMESWATRIEMFEKGRALQRLAQGEDPVTVMEDMSHRITQKMLHPILKEINSTTANYDVEKGRREYEEAMKHVSPAADHISED
jgi:glutamyl-tRNA reductase